MNLLYSHWNKSIGANGYNNFVDFVATLALSLIVSKRHFKKAKIVTNTVYKKLLIDELELPFEEVDTSHDELDNLPSWSWGYAKLHALNKQDENFVHIDNDVILWNKLNDNLKNKQLFFQSLESPFKAGYGWYTPLIKFARTLPNFPDSVRNSGCDHAFNCGVIGANNLDLIKEWYNLSTSFIRNEENIKKIEANKDLLIHQNLLHEQYFIATLAKNKGLKLNKDIGFVLDYKNLYDDAKIKGYTHLWGTTKTDLNVVRRVKTRLIKESPVYGKFLLEKLNTLF